MKKIILLFSLTGLLIITIFVSVLKAEMKLDIADLYQRIRTQKIFNEILYSNEIQGRTDKFTRGVVAVGEVHETIRDMELNADYHPHMIFFMYEYNSVKSAQRGYKKLYYDKKTYSEEIAGNYEYYTLLKNTSSDFEINKYRVGRPYYLYIVCYQNLIIMIYFNETVKNSENYIEQFKILLGIDRDQNYTKSTIGTTDDTGKKFNPQKPTLQLMKDKSAKTFSITGDIKYVTEIKGLLEDSFKIDEFDR